MDRVHSQLNEYKTNEQKQGDLFITAFSLEVCYLFSNELPHKSLVYKGSVPHSLLLNYFRILS